MQEWHVAPKSRGIAGVCVLARRTSCRNLQCAAGRVLNQLKNSSEPPRIVRAEEMSVHFDAQVDIPRNENIIQKMIVLPMPIFDANCTGLQGLMQVQRPTDFTDSDLSQLEIFAGVVARPLVYR